MVRELPQRADKLLFTAIGAVMWCRGEEEKKREGAAKVLPLSSTNRIAGIHSRDNITLKYDEQMPLTDSSTLPSTDNRLYVSLPPVCIVRMP